MPKLGEGDALIKTVFSSVLMYVHINMQAYLRSVCVVNRHRPSCVYFDLTVLQIRSVCSYVPERNRERRRYILFRICALG